MRNDYFAEHPELASVGKLASTAIFFIAIMRGLDGNIQGMIAEFFLTATIFCLAKTLERGMPNKSKFFYLAFAGGSFVVNRLLDNESFFPLSSLT